MIGYVTLTAKSLSRIWLGSLAVLPSIRRPFIGCRLDNHPLVAVLLFFRSYRVPFFIARLSCASRKEHRYR
ncbi:MAG: hypothetical protein KatS3mg025_1895 [Bacteroidia bacterium]|nr:MAG: hypothetical protein KatS3mg025_1895 [Bacteroidia bacterium]